MKPHIEDKCSSCFETKEDIDHILKCNCHKRKNIQENFLHDLSIKVKYRTPEIEPLILAGVSVWFNCDPIPDPSSSIGSTFTKMEINAYNAQTKIGWDNFLKGRLSLAWECTLGIEDKLQIKKWSWMMISSNWDFFLNMWNQRNSDMHREDNDQQKSKLLIKQASYLASQDIPIAPCDKHFTTIDENKMAQMSSTTTLRAWI